MGVCLGITILNKNSHLVKIIKKLLELFLCEELIKFSQYHSIS